MTLFVADLRGGSLCYCSAAKAGEASTRLLPSAPPGPAATVFCGGWDSLKTRDGSLRARHGSSLEQLEEEGFYQTLPVKSPSPGQGERLSQ